MRAITRTDSMQRRWRGKASITMLTALFAIAGGVQALAPASAAAMDDQPTTGSCAPVGIPGVGWNGTEFCVLADGDGSGSGGNGAGGDGSGSGDSGSAGEVIVVEGTTPPCVNPASCLPREPGTGGGRQDPDRAGSEPRPGRQLSSGAKMRQRAQCAKVNDRLRQLNARAVIQYGKELARYNDDHNVYFLEKPWLEARIPEIKQLVRSWGAKDCDQVAGLGAAW